MSRPACGPWKRPTSSPRRPRPSAPEEQTAVTWTEAVVVSRALATPDIAVIDLAPADGAEFPAWTAGAHIDVRLGGGLVRQYSLCGAPGSGRYRVAVLNEPESRGGS